jgi:pimeloyl-ACP methyl ester carboxylesterase
MKRTHNLHYETHGTGPTVVLLHGFLSTSAYWQDVIAELSANHQVVVIDLLGFGKSPKPVHSRYDYDAQLASIEHTLQLAGIPQPFTLVGHSMGSLIALRYARTHPEQVHKLLLANMPIFLTKRQARKEILNTNLAYRIGLRRGLHYIAWPLFRLAVRSNIVPEKPGEKNADHMKYMFQNNAASRLRSLRNIIFAATIQDDLEAVSVKTVILSGLKDREQYIHNLSRLRLGNHIQIATVDTGHHIPHTHPHFVTSYM